MKIRTTLALAAAAAALTATAASAQPYGHRGGWQQPQAHRGWQQPRAQWGGQIVNQRQAMMQRQIQIGVMRGAITRAEARRLEREFRQVARLEARYRRNGLSYAERADLDRRLDRLQARIYIESRDRDYAYGYSRW